VGQWDSSLVGMREGKAPHTARQNAPKNAPTERNDKCDGPVCASATFTLLNDSP